MNLWFFRAIWVDIEFALILVARSSLRDARKGLYGFCQAKPCEGAGRLRTRVTGLPRDNGLRMTATVLDGVAKQQTTPQPPFKSL